MRVTQPEQVALMTRRAALEPCCVVVEGAAELRQAATTCGTGAAPWESHGLLQNGCRAAAGGEQGRW